MALAGRAVVPQAAKRLSCRAWWAIALTTLATGLFLACTDSSVAPAADGSNESGEAAAAREASTRVVRITTTACGAASRTTGVGVIVDAGVVVTAAHVVAGAGSVQISRGEPDVADSDSLAADIVVLDRQRDLAVLRAEVESSPLSRADALAGDMLVAPLPDGSRPSLTVRRRVRITIDDVRGMGRSSRDGYELSTGLVPGDSGAGLFDNQGRLVAVFFSRSVERAVVYAVSATEVSAVLDAARAAHTCDAALSRVVPTGG